MYQTTGDKAYLFKFIDHAAEIQSIRGTNAAATANHGVTNWSEMYYQNGLILWPMAHFVYLVKQEEPLLQSIPLNPLPCSVQGQPCLDLSTIDYATIGQFAVWLSNRVDQTLVYAIQNY